MYYSFFIQSSVDRHLGCFHFLDVVNSAAMNTEIHVSFSVLISLGYMPRSEISGLYGGFTDLHLSDSEWCWASFHVLVSHLYVFFGGMSLEVPFPPFDWVFLVLNCISCLYVLEINSLSVASFIIIFSHLEGCLFTLLIVSIVVQKFLILIRSHLFIFAFIFNILEGGS